jgi:LysM repeat protein
MNRRQLAFLVLVNALVSLVVALGVVWVFEARRPDPEALAAVFTPRPEAVLAAPAAATPLPVAPPSTAQGGEPAAPAAGEATPQPTAAAPATPAGPEDVYIVQPGDTLLGIATRFNILVEDILRANNLSNPDYVFSGQRLVIPVQGAGEARDTPADAVEPAVEGVQIAAVTAAGDLANEVVQLANESDTAVNLQGWRLELLNGPAYTFGNVPLFPGGGVRVHSAPGVDTTLDLYWNRSEPAWQSGSLAQLVNAQGIVVNTYTVP